MQASELIQQRVCKVKCDLHGEHDVIQFKMNVWAPANPECPVCAKIRREKERAAQVERDRARDMELWAKSVNVSGIPKRFSAKSFDKYVATCSGQQAALDKCVTYSNRLIGGDEGRFLIMTGRPGTGKNHLSCCIGLEAIKSGMKVVFGRVDQLIRFVRDTYRSGSNMTEMQAINKLVGCDLLIMDEVGTERGTDEDRRLIFSLLDDRYSNMKSTILISNHPVKSAGGVDGLDKILGARIIDRMRECGDVIVFDWESYRGN